MTWEKALNLLRANVLFFFELSAQEIKKYFAVNKNDRVIY
jgi:hypothetical protein